MGSNPTLSAKPRRCAFVLSVITPTLDLKKRTGERLCATWLDPAAHRLPHGSNGTTVHAMPPHMVLIVVAQTGYGGVLHVPVSVPFVAELIDGVKYMRPDDVKEPEDDTERRRYRSRGPTLRSLVRLALRCENAEQLGQQIKRRYDRSLQRQGLAKAGRERDDRALDSQLERLLAEPAAE